MAEKKIIPYKISEYIKEHFREDFLFEVKDVKEVKGHRYYSVEVAKDDVIHKLTFNEKGSLVEEVADDAFPTDWHEERGLDDIP